MLELFGGQAAASFSTSGTIGEGLSEEFFVNCLKTVSSSFGAAVRELDEMSLIKWSNS